MTLGVLVRALTGGLPEEDARVLTFATLVVADLGVILANRSVSRSVLPRSVRATAHSAWSSAARRWSWLQSCQYPGCGTSSGSVCCIQTTWP